MTKYQGLAKKFRKDGVDLLFATRDLNAWALHDAKGPGMTLIHIPDQELEEAGMDFQNEGFAVIKYGDSQHNVLLIVIKQLVV